MIRMKKSSLGALLAGLMVLVLAACSASAQNARVSEREGKLDQAARQYEAAARSTTGASSSTYWYRAARLWIDPANSRRSYARALACFRRVNEQTAGSEVARETRLWKAALANLVSAQEAAREAESIISAFEDVSRGSTPQR